MTDTEPETPLLTWAEVQAAIRRRCVELGRETVSTADVPEIRAYFRQRGQLHAVRKLETRPHRFIALEIRGAV